jgi:hypothetical protein
MKAFLCLLRVVVEAGGRVGRSGASPDRDHYHSSESVVSIRPQGTRGLLGHHVIDGGRL